MRLIALGTLAVVYWVLAGRAGRWTYEVGVPRAVARVGPWWVLALGILGFAVFALLYGMLLAWAT